MGTYNVVDPGSKVWRSRHSIGGTHDTTIDFGLVYPIVAKFVLPGDVIRISARAFARYQPTLAPVLNNASLRAQFFYVNLRQVQENIADIITGTHDGKALVDVPECPNFVADVTEDTNFVVTKGYFWDYLGVPCLDYKAIKNDKCLPAQYWYKAYQKIYYDYFRDENLSTFTDFDTFWNSHFKKLGGKSTLFSRALKKDYFTSATIFEMKGTVPTFDVEVTAPFYDDRNIYQFELINESKGAKGSTELRTNLYYADGPNHDYVAGQTESNRYLFTPGGEGSLANAHGDEAHGSEIGESYPFAVEIGGDKLNSMWKGTSGTFNTRDIRTMTQMTRIKEREMRCGSRYTEYLRSNFHVAPADETLQRPIYLGGFKQPIVTNEVLQTGPADSSPVGTLRGKGITDGGNSIRAFRAKEFGIIFGLIDVQPDTIYTQGINRELTYKSRYDFFNPSFQNLSEQEVRNGEVFISNSDGKNDDTFGFQGMYNELRSRRNIVTSELRDSLKYWTQAIEFSERPNLNESFIESYSYRASYKRPFAVEVGANPIILHFEANIDAYRPMISHPVPGYLDHN